MSIISIRIVPCILVIVDIQAMGIITAAIQSA